MCCIYRYIYIYYMSSVSLFYLFISSLNIYVMLKNASAEGSERKEKLIWPIRRAISNINKKIFPEKKNAPI